MSIAPRSQAGGWSAGRRLPRSPCRRCPLVPVVLALLVALVAVGVPSGRVRAATPAPATSYRLDAAVDLERASVAVSEVVQIRNVVGVPLDTLVFRVVPNTWGRST